MPERGPKQLFSNIMFALQDAGVLDENEAGVMEKLEKVTAYMQQAILASRPDTTLFFIDDQADVQKDIDLSEIAIDEKGLPVFTSTIGLDPIPGGFLEYALFTWKTKDGHEFSAGYSHLAFYTQSNRNLNSQ